MGSLGPFLGDTHTVSLYLNECKEVGITYEHLVKEKPWRDLNTRIRVLELSGRQYAAVTRVLARKKYNYLHVLEILMLKNLLSSKRREGEYGAT